MKTKDWFEKVNIDIGHVNSFQESGKSRCWQGILTLVYIILFSQKQIMPKKILQFA